MKKPCITDLIYERTYPKPKSTDPATFYVHVHRHIVGEIRAEVQTYYGAIDTLEAQYPGLDYTYPPHRRRLSRYVWHRRLFRVFDELGLTNEEILDLCRWEGTRAAKERYEQEAQTEIRTTTGDDVVAAPVGSGPRAIFEEQSDSFSGESPPSEGVGTIVDEIDDECPEHYEWGKRLDSPPYEEMDNLFAALQNVILLRQGEYLPTNEALHQWLMEALERHQMDMGAVMRTIQNLDADPTRPTRENGADGSQQFDREQSAVSPTISNHEETQPLQHISGDPEVLRDSIYNEQIITDQSVQTNSATLAAESTATAFYVNRIRTEVAR